MSGINSGNSALDKQVENWLAWDLKGSESYRKVQDLIAKNDWTTLDDLMTKVKNTNLGIKIHSSSLIATFYFTQRQKFGTAGIRGVMEPG